MDRLGGAIGLVATAVVGLPVLLGQLLPGWPNEPIPLGLWTTLYLAFLAAFLLDATCPPWRPVWLNQRVLLVIQLTTATGTYLVAPRYGWSAVLLVVAAVSGGYLLSGIATVLLVAGLTAVAGLGALLAGVPPVEALITTLAYGAFLAFAALVVHAQRQATEAKTELAAAHAQLRASSALLAESRANAERLRIARELHDLVGHQLTALSLELEVAGHHADGQVARHVRRARDTAKGLLHDVREAVGDLRAPDAGLVAPLEALVSDVPGLDVHLRVVEEAPVDAERAQAIVRCVQEAVTNTLRHASADNLWVTVTAATDGIHVQARDDGRAVGRVIPGNGLTGMRERLEQLGGELTFDGGRGQGFTLSARVPAT